MFVYNNEKPTLATFIYIITIKVNNPPIYPPSIQASFTNPLFPAGTQIKTLMFVFWYQMGRDLGDLAGVWGLGCGISYHGSSVVLALGLDAKMSLKL